MSDAEHLSHNHRATLQKVFQHPVSHNLEWNDVRSLLAAVGEVEERRDGKIAVTLNGLTQTLERPRHKDLDAQEVIDVRRLLENAGYDGTAK